MGVTIINYGGYICDKCGHKWVTKDSKSVKGEEDTEKIRNELKTKKPKICPKCKSKKWNYLGLNMEKDKELNELYKKEFSEEELKMIKCREDVNFRIKIVKEEIQQKEKEIKEHNNRIKSDQELLKLGEKILRDLKEELTDLKKIQKKRKSLP